MYADKKVFDSISASLLYTGLQKLLSAQIRFDPRKSAHVFIRRGSLIPPAYDILKRRVSSCVTEQITSSQQVCN